MSKAEKGDGILMTIRQLLLHTATYTGSFLIMTVFMIIAIINAKKKTAWIWYAIGSAFQLLSLLGSQKNAIYTGENFTVDWIIYLVLLIGSAILVINKHNSSETRNKNLGCKWFVFYSRVRPFSAIFFTIPCFIDFFEYIDVYMSNLWLVLSFAGTVTGVVLCVMVFIKSFGDYREFVRFTKGVLLFETIDIPYQQCIIPYVHHDSDFAPSFIVFVIMLILFYFLWYRLNIKYFEKRISHLTSLYPPKPQNPEPYKSRFTECPECKYIAVFEKACPKCGFVLQTEVQESDVPTIPRILYCRKCGSKLPENVHFCTECGTEIVTNQPI